MQILAQAVAMACLLPSTFVLANTDPPPVQTVFEPIVVKASAKRSLPLDESAAAASRLGLSVRETPASVEVIGQELIEQRGARTLEEALRGAVGISVGGNPTSPGIASTRGFSGGFLTYLYDGMRVSTPTMSNRPQDSWNYERIEVLKGPASVLYGEGGIGGAVNFVTKQPDANNPGFEALLSYGSFNTSRMGAGTGGALGEHAAYRIDFSHQQSDGYAERGKQKLDHLTTGIAVDLAPRVKLNLSLDYLQDDGKAYNGTPLVPSAFAEGNATSVVRATDGRVIDSRMVGKNYNVSDGRMDANSLSARARLNWQLSDTWKLRNELSHYQADRRWRNAEQAVFNKTTSLLDRDQVDVAHDHQVWANRLDLSHEGKLGELGNRFIAGLEYAHTDFSTQRRFSNGLVAAPVDPLNPVVGTYDDNPALTVGAGNRTDLTTKAPVASLFAENALKLMPSLTLVAGFRHDHIRLDRTIADLNTGSQVAFSKSYNANSFRLGAVYDLSKATTLYAQLADAAAPVGTSNLLLLSAANANFPLTRGRQIEAGIKQTLPEARLDWTAAIYRIVQSNVLSRDAAKPSLTVNNGQVSSKGVELAAAWRASRDLTLLGNLAILDAQFDTLTEAGGVSRIGNVPVHVPKRTANLWMDYRFAETPWSVGGGLSHVGAMYTDNANTVRINGYTLADAYVSYRLPHALITLRGRNLGDKLYATWSGASATNQVILGSPRSVDLSVKFHF
ncbi:iron complex outermembrane receptor protein [Chitinivorax tropicus]|uniref:Iron complex outermembrane receptor protein n=1 Tax=Chitinivorax tropicus TaxID=714531 RepID=A0A840MP36_9PROT|nr:TonB-dependent siderophore receptor [Chitinivorax tropicus]MBB5017943.1 iron complex outermembrane receptor protein [Chitinivorax tropicus]